MKRLMILGSGSSGRGHLGQLAHEAGWELILVDRDRALIQRLQQAGCYTVRLCRADSVRSVVVDRFRAFHASETEPLVRAGLEVSLILTCLFSQNLPGVAPLVAQIIAGRHAAGISEPLNVICGENMQHGSTVFRSQVMPLLSPAVAAYAERHVGFPDCMISRVVPVALDPLVLSAEDYNEWTVDQAQFAGPPVDLPAMELVANQEARLARKFFLHNGAHAVCAYWGFHRGHEFIHEAVADPEVLGHVQSAIDELAEVVARRYGFTFAATRAYGLELGPRGAVAVLRDRILRVVREPLRKLSRDERLVAPAVMAAAAGVPYEELARTIAAALRYFHPDDPQAVTMRERLQQGQLERVLPDIMGLAPDHPLVAKVIPLYSQWR